MNTSQNIFNHPIDLADIKYLHDSKDYYKWKLLQVIYLNNAQMINTLN